jgi:hypothetical protein
VRRAFKAFDGKFLTGIGKRILGRYFIDGGKRQPVILRILRSNLYALWMEAM